MLNCWELVCISSNSSAENDNQPAKTFYDLYRISYLSPGSPKTHKAHIQWSMVLQCMCESNKPSRVLERVDLSLFSRAIFSKAFLTAPALSQTCPYFFDMAGCIRKSVTPGDVHTTVVISKAFPSVLSLLNVTGLFKFIISVCLETEEFSSRFLSVANLTVPDNFVCNQCPYCWYSLKWKRSGKWTRKARRLQIRVCCIYVTGT